MKRFLKTVVPSSWIRAIRAILEYIDLITVRFFSLTPRLSGIYYAVLSRRFDREHQSVLKGRLEYQRSIRNVRQSCALLRRNIHRLEKGLIMKPRRAVFAESFIRETVVCYKQSVEATGFCAEEEKWARDVLAEYFSVVSPTKRIEEARELFQRISPGGAEDCDVDLVLSKPYPYKQLPEVLVSFDDIRDLYIRRRSVRWYQDSPVSFSLIQQAADVAAYAPSACNRQPYRYLIATDKDKAVEIAKCAGGTAGFAGNLPAMVVIVGDLSAYPKEKDRHLIYIDGSLAAMQLMLALETLGLSSCPINWPDVESAERKIRKVVELQYHERVVMLLAVGYADESGGIPYSQKKKGRLIAQEVS